ncbi:MAG: putative porin [Bacteroidaceae bacterium]|nr:putative porin [Bacteroidaceae bacterium]
MNRRLVLLLMLVLCLIEVRAQDYSQTDNDGYSSYNKNKDKRTSWGRDTTENKLEDVPIGVHQWTVDERLGNIIEAENLDTAVHMFQYFNETTGYNGEYSILGNLGSPRLSRIYMHRSDVSLIQFLNPFSFFIGGIQDFRFSNTLSPLTNLAYHSVGNKQNGQERVRAYFASNINKVSGIGMKFDYLYGRGYYNSQANSQFGGTLFGYYLGDRYNLHAYVNLNHFKMAENGGIENDAYIRNPQSFPRRYGSKDIPTLLTETWNRNQNQNAFLTHRYNLGFHREIEIADSLKPKMPNDTELLMQLSDSLRELAKADTLRRTLLLDSLRTKWTAEQIIPTEFVPVSSIIHTLNIENLRHTYYSYNTPSSYYTNLYYGDLTSVTDVTKDLIVRNTVALAMREGFNKWAQMGIALFATHKLETYTLPSLDAAGIVGNTRYTEHNLYVGGEINRTQGKLIHYNVNGEISVAGADVGEFEVDGIADLDLKLGKRDTLEIEAHAFVKDLAPNIYFYKYHSQFLWWDNPNFSKEFKTRIEGSLRLPRIGTNLTVGLENVKNYTYYAMQNTYTGSDPTSILPTDYSHDVVARQHGGNIQVFSVRLCQDLAFGPFHWDNDVTYQTTSNATVLPLPKLTLYSNLYLHFRIAKVLNVEVGGDVRYFTKYYAPDYSPAIQQFAVQDTSQPLVKIGNYPIVNAYVNLHIKHCRLYLAMNHLNAGSGRMFWVPHYPIDPRTFHFGVSWNFFN